MRENRQDARIARREILEFLVDSTLASLGVLAVLVFSTLLE
jgi:hypothetical protein